MGIFKKSDDVLDLTDMQRRGLLKKAAEIEQQAAMQSASGYMDLSSGVPSRANASSGSSSGGSQFDFLDALSGVGASSSGGSSAGSAGASGADVLEIQGLKNKIDDLEYKIRVLEDKIARMEE